MKQATPHIFLCILCMSLATEVPVPECKTADWWKSLDRQGWSECPQTNTYLKGLWRNDRNPTDERVGRIEQGRCCEADEPCYTLQLATCSNGDWSTLLDGFNVWALCPKGYYMNGLRLGKDGANFLKDIEEAKCCHPESHPNLYEDCYDEDVSHSFNYKGWSDCKRDGYYMTGFYKGTCNQILCIEKFRCCKMKTVKPYPPQNVTVDSKSSGVVNISWESGFDERKVTQNYTVEISQDNQKFRDAVCQGSLSNSACVVSSSFTSVSLQGLFPWTTYYIRVFAKRKHCTSNSSSVIDVATDEEGMWSVALKASHSLVNVSGRTVINCTVIGGPEDLNITWLKAGKVIDLSHRTKVDTGVRHSLLTVTKITEADEGAYICQTIKGYQKVIANITIRVVPLLEITPRTVTKRLGDKATFTCSVLSGYRRGARVLISEVTKKGNEVRHQQMNFTATNLQIPEGEKSYVRKFVCEMWSQRELFSRSEVAELIIIGPDAPRCPEELLDGVLWSATAATGKDVKPCPNGASGTASRSCSEKASWKDSNFVTCISPEFIRLGDEIDAITGGFQSNLNASQVLSQLVNATTIVQNKTRRPQEMFGGDLSIAIKILVKIADYSADQDNVNTEKDVENFAQVASNLLDSTNRITWWQLEKVSRGHSQVLVKAVDDYGLGVAATFTGLTASTAVKTRNLLMQINHAKKDSPMKYKEFVVAYNQTSIHLPAQVFDSSRNTRIITVVYHTLNDVLQLGSEKEKEQDEQPLFASSTIVSSTVHPRPPDVLNKPVKVILQNKMGNSSVEVRRQTKCVFWRPGESAVWQTTGCRLVPSESNITLTTCECNHLTIFASLMNPYASAHDEAHHKALEIISIVGCSISFFAVAVTMAVTLFFWKKVKSPSSKILLNLCVAIAISCILVIIEGSLRQYKVGCTVSTSLLHYFLLALFCWMLCEGVLFYILIVKVVKGGGEDKVKYFYMFGWGFPAIIVAISLGVTQTDGYGSSAACWLDVKNGLIWAFVAPAVVIILINIVVFTLVIRQMMGTRSFQKKTQIEKVKTGIRGSVVILPLLGITWLFGLLSFSSATVTFKYIFTITNSLQGLMIFVFHCLLNKEIKDAIKLRRRRARSKDAFSAALKSLPGH